jgi:hypothetical protein
MSIQTKQSTLIDLITYFSGTHCIITPVYATVAVGMVQGGSLIVQVKETNKLNSSREINFAIDIPRPLEQDTNKG